MPSTQFGKASTTAAAVLALLLLILTLSTVYVFVAKTWWFPPSITSLGREIDQQFHRTDRKSVV